VVSEKGQVTIPKKLRERLGIKAGDVLDFHEEQGRLVAIKRVSGDPVGAVYGILTTLDDPYAGMSSDEYMDFIRGPADPPAG